MYFRNYLSNFNKPETTNQKYLIFFLGLLGGIASHPTIPGIGGGFTGTHLPFGRGGGHGIGLGRVGGVSLAGNPDGGTTAHTSPMDPLGLYGLNHAIPGLAGTIGSNTFAGGNHPIGSVGGGGAGGGGGGGGELYNATFV